MEKLALIDGEKYRTVPKRLRAHWPRDWISEKDLKVVIETIRKGEYWKKEEREKLEKEWTEYCGAKKTISVINGTAALHIAISAAGVGPGDEVITPAFSFLSSATPILQNQGIPIFVDICPRTLNINPKLLESKITSRTKAILTVHMHGLPADMDEINKIAKKYGLMVIEDACHAPGAEYKGRKTGSLGDFAAFSMHPTKNLAAFGGGLLTINNKEDKIKKIIHQEEGMVYALYGLGWNYNYNEVGASFVRSQLKRLDKSNKWRQKNAEYLSKGLRSIKGISLPFVPEDRTHTYFIYRLLLKPEEFNLDISPVKFRNSVLEALVAEGVAAQTYETSPIPSQSIFKKLIGYGNGCPWSCKYTRKINFKKEYDASNYPETVNVLNSSIVLYDSLYPPNGKELMDSYIKAFKKIFNHRSLERILKNKKT